LGFKEIICNYDLDADIENLRPPAKLIIFFFFRTKTIVIGGLVKRLGEQKLR
jgi:hypothetical protein